jgi:hypothetical protein
MSLYLIFFLKNFDLKNDCFFVYLLSKVDVDSFVQILITMLYTRLYIDTTTKYTYYNKSYYNKNDYCGNTRTITSIH